MDTGNNGRLGNQIMRNVAVSLIAEKHNLKYKYFNHTLISKLGITLFSGKRVFNKSLMLTDDNYFSMYHSPTVYYNLNPKEAYLQTKEIGDLIYRHLQSDLVRSNVISKNPYHTRYRQNNDLYIHIRLGDVQHHNPGLNYYRNTIQTIQYDKLYISTDDKTHSTVVTLLQHPNATLIEYDEINTIQFASTCKHIILSHGSFSAIIGYLAYFSTIYYPEYEANKIWYADLFSIDGWNKMHFLEKSAQKYR